MSDLSPVNLPPSARRRGLTKGQKAAVIVRLLITGGADPGIRSLPAEQQKQLVRDMSSLRFVDRETLAQTVAEFASELDSIGLHFPRDVDRILTLMDGSLSLEVVEALLADFGGAVGSLGQAAWAEVANLDTGILAAMMQDESDEVCAIMLSKLPPAKAALLLGTLPQDRCDGIAVAFGRTEDVSPEAVSMIGNALGRQSGARKPPAFDTAAVARVGDILNAATSGIRRALLDRLDESDPDFAVRVRAEIFSFENIPDRIDPRDVPRVLRGVDAAVVTQALAGAPPDLAPVVEFILGSISSRLADQMREDMAEGGKVATDAAEEAMSAIVSEIRRLEEEGELTLNAPDS
ncbi:flagellar motor switch protein FliG [Jannaschia sp. M317]|uniref:flagellar motor switch protein FliG n=1 Tax=Jannaschia sp. M317 TaxID=2867011 RepID=UPI0021A7D9D7|nr:FliG C-terminal domain-containing protein [Jannaschia sp. M317]UWQ16490.1 flagellar motor switch protein FliG [Jannaschia sp. M317]